MAFSFFLLLSVFDDVRRNMKKQRSGKNAVFTKINGRKRKKCRLQNSRKRHFE